MSGSKKNIRGNGILWKDKYSIKESLEKFERMLTKKIERTEKNTVRDSIVDWVGHTERV